MRVVRLRQQGYKARALRGRIDEQEAEAHDSAPPHVVRHVRHREVQQALHCAIVAGAAVRERDDKHASVPNDGVLVPRHLLDQSLCPLLPGIHGEGEAHGQAADDLLVLGVMRISQHLLPLLCGRAHEQQTHGDACRLAGDGGVGVQHVLEVLEDLLVLGAQPRHPQPQARPVLCDLALRCAQRLQQEFPDVRAVVGVNEAQCIQSAALRVRAATATIPRQVGRHQCPPLSQMAGVDDSQPGGGRELGPVGGASQPLKILPQECVHGGALVHHRIGEDDGAVTHRMPCLNRVLHVFENLQVRMIT
mmetsp:Transcript_5894/g.16829  ORF Transcript_5894/g.16829 Transcript_5894/m.16829 type:complete len:305 (+) Transcript_5894:1588-2502(+)